jgi:hypothetical protein
MNKRSYLHLGAHRTGSSSFQQCLYENRKILSGLGFDIAYPDRDGVPDGLLRMKLPRKRHGERRVGQFAPKLRAHLESLTQKKKHSLVLSEENIPGLMRHFSEGLFYPGSKKRLATVAQALEKRPEACLYIVRSYDELFTSRYRLNSAKRPMRPFHEIEPALMDVDRGWIEIVTEIRDTLRPKKLYVLPYEVRGSSTELLRTLLCLPDTLALEEPEKNLNVSLSDAALAKVQQNFTDASDSCADSTTGTNPDFPATAHHPHSAEFSDGNKSILMERYAIALEHLQNMEGVVLLGQ